uniref:SH3 domain-containing protein n=1 Tax=Monopterus albus TaxID=43700 RepID=A0A3Q3JTB2_MONAL
MLENKADVKAIMARFQTSGPSSDESSSTPAGRTKQSLHPTLSSGVNVQTKKPVLESVPGSAINVTPKPTFLKNAVSPKSDTEAQEPNKSKALASRFANSQNDTNSKPFIVNKQQTPLKPSVLAPEAKIPGQKPALSKPSLSSTLSDSKVAFPKPPLAVSSKPSWVKEDSGGGTPPTTSPTPLKMPLQQKPSSLTKLLQQNEGLAGTNTDTTVKASPPTNSTPKPASNFRATQNMFIKQDRNEQSDSGGAKKPPLTATNSIPPPKPLPSKKPSLRMSAKPSPQASSVNDNVTSGPKRNTLPNSFALGPAPAKPNRPPRVNLEKFKRPAEASDEGNELHHGGSFMFKSLTTSTFLVFIFAKSHYLCLKREAVEQKQEKKKEKDEKEEKKRLEAEKKEQKEREKKEQDARKKFKFVGPLEVIHQGKARVDCKGSKTDLGLKQGDSLDIIRVQGNPEGKWLGRTQDGSIGYVKTTSVEIDFNTLKNRQPQQAYEPEVYDDIDVASDNRYPKCKIICSYSTSVSLMFCFVLSLMFLPSPTNLKGKSKTEEMDPKKQKKFEKEEKDFRKKFKYDSEIRVLYQVTVVNTLTNKKWSGKELPIKAAEKLDVIAKAVDNKLICRNDEGKCEYLLFVCV